MTKTEGTWAFWAPRWPRPRGPAAGRRGRRRRRRRGGAARLLGVRDRSLGGGRRALRARRRAAPFSGETPTGSSTRSRASRRTSRRAARGGRRGGAAGRGLARARNLPADVPKGCRRALAGLLRVDPRRLDRRRRRGRPVAPRGVLRRRRRRRARRRPRGRAARHRGPHLFDGAVYAERVVVSDADRAASIKGAEHARRVAQAIGRCREYAGPSQAERAEVAARARGGRRGSSTVRGAHHRRGAHGGGPRRERADQSGEDRGSTPDCRPSRARPSPRSREDRWACGRGE